MNDNPYASPAAEEQPEVPPYQDLKDDRLLVTPVVCTLPPRCVYCNAAAGDARLAARYWSFSWSGLRRAKVQWHTCPAHKGQLNRQALPGFVAAFAYLAVFLGSALHDLLQGEPDWLEGVPRLFVSYIIWVFLLAAVLPGWLMKNWLKAPAVAKLKRDHAYLKHAGRPFLDSLADGAEGVRVVDKVPP